MIVFNTHAEPYYCEMMGNHKSCKTEESCKGRLNILRAPILLLKTTTSSTPWTSRCKDQVCHRWQHPEFGKWWKCIRHLWGSECITNERETETAKASFIRNPLQSQKMPSVDFLIFCLVSVTPPLKALSTFTQRTCARATFSGCTAVIANTQL